eukprot:6731808-Prymnesium_polylepis.1
MPHGSNGGLGPLPHPRMRSPLRRGTITPHRSECGASPLPPHALAQPSPPPPSALHTSVFTRFRVPAPRPGE